ncbi:hypothetical protein M422DRAFT_776385 [Sphaerobolus stellatus SS14]|nr:hypothetical protein M422DRAFT_776385 [Sphaerobolus stellatus SS14]
MTSHPTQRVSQHPTRQESRTHNEFRFKGRAKDNLDGDEHDSEERTALFLPHENHAYHHSHDIANDAHRYAPDHKCHLYYRHRGLHVYHAYDDDDLRTGKKASRTHDATRLYDMHNSSVSLSASVFTSVSFLHGSFTDATVFSAIRYAISLVLASNRKRSVKDFDVRFNQRHHLATHRKRTRKALPHCPFVHLMGAAAWAYDDVESRRDREEEGRLGWDGTGRDGRKACELPSIDNDHIDSQLHPRTSPTATTSTLLTHISRVPRV